jgi:DNA-binding protein HU-beta
MTTVGKSEIIQKVAEKSGISNAKASQAVNATLDSIADALKKGEEVRITGFGSFRVTHTKEKMGRHPRTGEPIQIPAGKRPSFSPGSKLVEAARSSAS